MLAELFTVVLAIALYLIWKRRKQLYRLKDLSGPPSLPIIGNVLEVLSLKDTLRILLYWTGVYENFLIYLGLKPYFFVTNHKLIEFLLSSNKFIEKSADYRLMENWLGDGLLISGGAKWKKRRKVFTPAFHYNILDDYVQVFESKTSDLIKNLNEKVGQDSFDVYGIISRYTLDVICETAMGTSVNCQRNPNSVYAKSINDLCEVGFRKCVMPLYQVNSFYKYTSLYKKESEAIDVVHGFSKSIIQSRKKILQDKVEENRDDFGLRRKSNFLDILLQSTIDGKHLTDEDILEEVEIFMFEGHDTTSICISAALYFLSMNPEIQDKVVEELNEIFQGDKTKSLTQQDFSEMKYLEQVIKETLRLCPSVPVQAREIKEDTFYDGKLIPKGLTVVIYTYGIHRNPEVYPDPEKFDPERFSSENQRNRHPFAYIPFSAGPRNCIGQKFAMLELKSSLSKILLNFVVLPTNVPKYKPELIVFITMKSLNGIQIKLERRK